MKLNSSDLLLSSERGFEPRHHGYEPCALANWLSRHILRNMGPIGLEPKDPLLVRQMLSS